MAEVMTLAVSYINVLSEDPDIVVERFKNLPPGVSPLMAASGLLIVPKYIALEKQKEK